MEPGQNPFLFNPFQPLELDPARLDPDKVFATYIEIVNALGALRHEQGANHSERLDLGTTKGEAYDKLNKPRYDLEYKIKTLGEKKDALEHLFFFKGREFRSSDRGQRWAPQ